MAKSPFNFMRPQFPDNRRVVETSETDLLDIHNDLRQISPLMDYTPFEIDRTFQTGVTTPTGMIYLDFTFSQIRFGVIKSVRIENVTYEKRYIILTVDNKAFAYNYMNDDFDIDMNIPITSNTRIVIFTPLSLVYPLTVTSFRINGFTYNQ